MGELDLEIAEIHVIVQQIAMILAGKQTYIQGAVLADCLATWISGHRNSEGDRQKTLELRNNILALHIQTVGELIDVNDAMWWGGD